MKNLFAITTIICLALSCSAPSSTEEAETESSNIPAAMEETPAAENVLRHVVLFKFKESATPDDIKKVEEAFAALPAKIPEIKGFEWGTNNSPEGLDKGYTHCFFLTFANDEGRATYLPHPDHKVFGELIGPYIEDVLVVDYFTGK